MESVSALETALEAAIARYDLEGERALKRRLDHARTQHVLIREGRRYDADVLGRLILAEADPRVARLGDVPARLVEAAGETVIATATWSVEDERAWRMAVWEAAKGHDVDATWLRNRGVYGGMQGIWVDAARTRSLAPEGVAVAVLHTGRHYADDIDDRMAIYYYPHTARPAARDRNEVEAVKNAGEFHLPIFLIGEGPGKSRTLRLAWVVAADDEAEIFLLEFAESEPRHLDLAEPSTPFVLRGSRTRVRSEHERYRRDPEFKFRVLHRYRGRCAVTGVGVPVVLDAAHVVEVADGGTDDERNGLLLTATLHRAFDANLWAVEPRTLELRTRRRGFSLADLQVKATSLRSGVPPPHEDALAWRWGRFTKGADPEALDDEVVAASG